MWRMPTFRRKPAIFLIGTIGDQHAEEIIPVFEPMGDPGAERIDILEDGGILDAINVLIDHGIECTRS